MTPEVSGSALFESVCIEEGSPIDVEFWAIVLGAPLGEVRRAINVVGTSVPAVRAYLQHIGQIAPAQPGLPLG